MLYMEWDYTTIFSDVKNFLNETVCGWSALAGRGKARGEDQKGTCRYSPQGVFGQQLLSLAKIFGI